jgi:hypothetical protein
MPITSSKNAYVCVLVLAIFDMMVQQTFISGLAFFGILVKLFHPDYLIQLYMFGAILLEHAHTNLMMEPVQAFLLMEDEI